jgi:hypothetical protein
MAMNEINFRFGPYSVDFHEESIIEEGSTVSGESARGIVSEYHLCSNEKLQAIIHYVKWSNGESDIRCSEVQDLNTPDSIREKALKRLERGSLRLGIHGDSEWDWIELRQARYKTDSHNHWSNLFNATEKQLNEGAGIMVTGVLEDLGAFLVGTKRDILGVGDNTRGRLCACFDKDNFKVPLAAFVLTRISPLAMLYPA